MLIFIWCCKANNQSQIRFISFQQPPTVYSTFLLAERCVAITLTQLSPNAIPTDECFGHLTSHEKKNIRPKAEQSKHAIGNRRERSHSDSYYGFGWQKILQPARLPNKLVAAMMNCLLPLVKLWRDYIFFLLRFATELEFSWRELCGKFRWEPTRKQKTY